MSTIELNELETILFLLKKQYGDASFQKAIKTILTVGDIQIPLSVNEPVKKGEAKKRKGRKKTSIKDQKSIALFSLETSDPDKYSLLLPFDRKMRTGELFPVTRDLKEFAGGLSKDLKKLKTRQSLISNTVQFLSSKNLDEIKSILSIVDNKKQHAETEEDESYNKLAKFLISGKS